MLVIGIGDIVGGAEVGMEVMVKGEAFCCGGCGLKVLGKNDSANIEFQRIISFICNYINEMHKLKYEI